MSEKARRVINERNKGKGNIPQNRRKCRRGQKKGIRSRKQSKGEVGGGVCSPETPKKEG